MRKRQICEGLMAIALMAVFVLLFFGGAELANGNMRGVIECGIALVIAIPTIILSNKERRA